MASGAPWAHRAVASSYADTWRNVAWSEALRLWTAVGDNRGLQTSPDGKAWTALIPLEMAATDDINAAAWMQGATVPLMIIGGESDLIYTSPDGVTYTDRSLGVGINTKALEWSEVDAVLMLVGTDTSNNGGALKSTNGTDWSVVVAIANEIYTVTLGTVYVLAGQSGEIRSSADQGDNWTSRTAAGGYTGSFRASAWSGSLFVIGGASGEIQTSPDGTTWTAAATLSEDVKSLAWSPVDELFFATGDAGTIFTSPDAITWTQQIADDDYASTFYGVGVGRREVIAVGASGEIQTTEIVNIRSQHAANFRKLLPPGAAWGES